jgi:hypothetical protein
MRPITSEQLSGLITQIAESDTDTRDELLTDFLVSAYPTKSTQVN